MKQLTIILLTILTLGCAAQEPDTECYSIEYVDSIQTILTYSELENIRLNDSINLLQYHIVSDSTYIMGDSLYINIMGSGVTIEIIKEGQSVSLKTRPNNVVE